MSTTKRRSTGTCAAVVALVALWSALLVAPASAQEQPPSPGDPYGGTTTTAPGEPVLVRCDLAAQAVAPGASLTVRVTGVVPGGEVRLLLAGNEVARGSAPVAGQSVGAGAVFGGPALPAQAGTTELDLTFTVPALEPGTYRLDAVGATFTVGCGSDGTLEVLADGVVSLPRDGGDGSEGGAGLGSLPRTGLTIGVLVALALALLVLGRLLLRRAARHRRGSPRRGGNPRASGTRVPA